MNREATFACILSTVICAPGLTQTLSVDWKLYGGVPLDGDSWCFYEARGVIVRPDGHIRVWTQCLLEKDIDNIDIKNDLGKNIIENAAQKVASYYVPPIAVVEDIDVNQAMTITRYEETANISYIQPAARIFYELNCSERMMRELSTYLRAPSGQGSSSDKPSDWRYVPPQGNGATLLKILCPR
jgi:hypothetical protein